MQTGDEQRYGRQVRVGVGVQLTAGLACRVGQAKFKTHRVASGKLLTPAYTGRSKGRYLPQPMPGTAAFAN